MSADPRTAAQLLKLQKLVQSLVVRELEQLPGSRGPSGSGGDAAPPSRRHRAPATAGSGGGPTIADARQRPSSSGSDVASLFSLGPPAASRARAGGGSGGTGPAQGAATARRTAGAAAAPAGAGSQPWADGGVHVQAAELQGQLALLGEQLAAAYRAADGPQGSPPRGAAAVTAARQYGGGVGGAMNSPDRLGPLGGPAAAGPASFAGHPSLGGWHGTPAHAAGAAGTAAAGVTAPGASGLAADRSDFTSAGGGAGGLSGGGGGLSTGRMRQLAAEERAGREAAAREDERLRGWIQDLRGERRRLEDRLLDGDAGGGRLAAMRDDLEKQVLSLARQRDAAAAELSDLSITRAANAQLAAQVEMLEAALAAEAERVARYKEVRPSLEARIADVAAAVEALRQQHAAAVEALSRERDAAALKARRHARRAAELEASLTASHGEARRLEEEVRVHAVALAEVRASGEVLQSASNQLQANLEAQARDCACRLAAVQTQLEASQADAAILRRQLEAAQADAGGLREQVREGQARLDAARGEQERLGTALTEEQRASASARQAAEGLSEKLRSSEEARAEAARASAAQLEAVRRQHAADLAATQKQYESQLAGAEKSYLLLQRQYDSGLANSDQLAEAAATLRRERDTLWAEAENLKAELEAARKEKADVSAKLNSLRTEVRNTVEEVARDRDARLAAATGQSEVLLRDIRQEAEQRVANVQQEYETRLAGLMDAADKLRADAGEAQRQADRYRSTVAHLKEQVRDLLLSRDAAERELASERAFNEELNKILTTIKAEQQQAALESVLGR